MENNLEKEIDNLIKSLDKIHLDELDKKLYEEIDSYYADIVKDPILEDITPRMCDVL